MSKAPKKAAAAPAEEKKPAEATAPAAAEAAPEATPSDAHDQDKAKKKDARSPLEEAIELALASASTAVDSAQEIQRLRGEVQTLITGHNRNNKILIYAVLLILTIASAGVFGALVFYKRGFNEFDATAKVNREALMVFAGEINGLVAASKKIDEAIKLSSQQLKESQAMQEDLRKTIQGLTVGQAALANKINAPAPAANTNNDKAIAALQKSLDDILAANKVIAQRIGEIQAKQVAPPPAPAKPVAATPTPAQRAAAVRAREAQRERDMIRYP